MRPTPEGRSATPMRNKKKIRGWKRKIRQIEHWKMRHIDLDIEQLCRNSRDYVKLWIDPFYRLIRRDPPMWYSRLMLEAMSEVYQSWNQQMEKLKEPYYLKLWLYYPHFINSQVVVAFRESLNYYDHIFHESNDKKEFPSQQFGAVPGLNKWKWDHVIETADYCLSELQEDVKLGVRTAKEVESIKYRSYKTSTVKFRYGEDTVYHVKIGDVWLGEIS